MKINETAKPGLATKSPHTRQEAIDDPSSSFATPSTIIDSTILSSDEKGEALKNWAEDAERLSVAANEGMTGGEPSLLPEIKAAEAVLEKSIEADAHPAPAKKKR